MNLGQHDLLPEPQRGVELLYAKDRPQVLGGGGEDDGKSLLELWDEYFGRTQERKEAA